MVARKSQADDQQPSRVWPISVEGKLSNSIQKKPESVVKKYVEHGYPVGAAHTKAAKIAHGVARMN